MPPAFDSTRQATAFALLLLFLLSAPWLSAKRILPRPNETYSSETLRWEGFPWAQKFIFEETNDIDIAFVGSSRMLTGVNTPYVQAQLSERLGRPGVVRTVGWLYPGFDSLYFFSKDLLAHRHVRTLVFCDECAVKPHEVHQLAPDWFHFGEASAVVSGLPLKYQAIYYDAAVIGMPRNLLAEFSRNLPLEASDDLTGNFSFKPSANPEIQLGCMGTRLRFIPPDDDHDPHFSTYVPHTGITPAEVRLFTPETAADFAFSTQSLPASQLYFARQFALLAKSYGCQLLALHVPWFAERASPVIAESRDWASLMQTNVSVMGIPPARLFAGLSDLQIGQLYCDRLHLNLNGQAYFTRLITPALIQFYETHPHP